MKISIKTTTLLALALNVCTATAATITLGGFTFDTTAFPTSANFLSGGPPSLSFPTTGNINSDLLKATDSDLTSYIFGTPVDFTVTFGNAALQNRASADLVIFELGVPDDVSVKLGATTKTYLTVNTGFTAAGFNVNAIAIDLSDFGIASNALVSMIEVDNASPATGSASIDAIGGLSTAVPEPAMFVCLAGALVLLGLARRRRGGARN
ncbi:MAG: hypothetical protein ACRD9L_16580 [Bryobacteraceae bacterium]